MTATHEPPAGGGEIVAEFAEVANRWTEGFQFDDDALQVIRQMLARGSAEVLRLPEGPDRDEAIRIATLRLDGAMQEAARELQPLSELVVEADALTTVMVTLCPVPPFCLGAGPGSADPVQATGGSWTEVAEPMGV